MNRSLSQITWLLVGSGFCALVYQIAWLRELRLVFGGSTAASAAVLAIFMGGLGLGAALLGKRADKHPLPLALYARLELLITFSALVTPFLLWLARYLYILLGGSIVMGHTVATVVRLVLAAVVLGVPTILMGGTLPAAVKAVQTPDDIIRRHLAILYGANAVGAVIGAAMATFYLLEFLGTRNTLWSACALNGIVALTALGLAKRSQARAHSGSEAHESKVARAAVQGAPHHSIMRPHALPSSKFILVAAGVLGFAFFLMELVWFRMLNPILGGTTYTFGLILTIALLGIGAGGIIYGMFGQILPATLRTFALICAFEAVCLAIPYALGDRLAVLAAVLRPLGSVGFYGHVFGWAVVGCIVVLPAAIVAGFQFPLLIALLGEGDKHIGADTGYAYACNTFGAICGSMAGGFGLLPVLTAPGSWRAAVCLLVALSATALFLSLWHGPKRLGLVIPVGTMALAVAMVFATGPTAAWRHGEVGAGRAPTSFSSRNEILKWTMTRRNHILWEVDGVEASVALYNTTGLAFVINGKIDGHVLDDADTQVMSGLLGAMLHPHPRSAMVIGLGTGSTAGWLAAVPSITHVDVVELEPAILKVAKRCAPVNRSVLDNPRVKVIIGDGREVLQTIRRRYDLIFSEPSNPYRAGVASLYTHEFYQSVVERLNDQGLFIQWVQAYEIDSQTLRTIYATLYSVFPYIESWVGGPNDLLLICSAQPVVYDVQKLHVRVNQQPYKQAMQAAWRTVGVEGLLSHYLARSSLAATIAEQEGGRLNTDDKTLIEFGFARTVGHSKLRQIGEVRQAAYQRHEYMPQLTNGRVNWQRVEDLRLWLNRTHTDRPIYIAPTEHQRRMQDAVGHFLRRRYHRALDAWNAQPQPPQTPDELALVAMGLATAGDDAALAYIDQLRAMEPTEADVVLAILRWHQDQADKATTALISAFERHRDDPWPNQQLMDEAFRLTWQITADGSEMAAALFNALDKPFSVYANDELRLISQTRVASQLGLRAVTRALEAREPYVPWTEYYLRRRLAAYQAAGHRNVQRAKRDLERFLRNKAPSFNEALNVPAAN